MLTRTSNPGARLLQERDVDGRPLYLHVADLVARLGAEHLGDAGYSDVGAVAGATAPTSLRLVREALPPAFILVPGYGAAGSREGGSARRLRRRRRGFRGQRLALNHLRVAARCG